MSKTTDEMDGLFTEQDKARRYSIFLQCRKCSKWTKTDVRTPAKECEHCGWSKFDPQSATSERTFNPNNKRKVK